MTWLVESPWPSLTLGAAAVFVLTVLLVQTGRAIYLGAIGAAAALTLGMLLIERMVVTQTEEVEDALAGIAAALEANDVDAVMASIAPDCPRRGEISSTLPRFAIREAHVGGDLEVRFNQLASPPAATTYFTGRIVASDRRGEVPYEQLIRRFKVSLRKQGGRWLVANYSDSDPRDREEN